MHREKSVGRARESGEVHVRETLVWSLPVFFLVALGALPLAATSKADKIQAALIYNIAKMVKWPNASYGATNGKFAIGAICDSEFLSLLQKTLDGKTIRKKPISVSALSSPEDAKNVHIVFVEKSKEEVAPAVIAATDGGTTLTIGNFDGFTGAGGLVGLVPKGSKTKLEINESGIKGRGLKISSKLLKSATIVEN